MDTVQNLQQILKVSGQSLTTPRRAVFMALQNQVSMSMRELVACCSAVDRASVYRTVSLFESLGIVQRLQAGWKYTLELTGSFHDHHHHATCLGCSASLVVPEDTVIEKRLQELAQEVGFQMQRHQLEISGLCRQCQNNI